MLSFEEFADELCVNFLVGQEEVINGVVRGRTKKVLGNGGRRLAVYELIRRDACARMDGGVVGPLRQGEIAMPFRGSMVDEGTAQWYGS